MRRMTRGTALGAIVLGAGTVLALLAIGGGMYAFLGGAAGSSDVNLQKGLVSHWKLDGNAKDATPYGNNDV